MKIFLRLYIGIIYLFILVMIITTPFWMWIPILIIGENHRYVCNKLIDYCDNIAKKYELFGQLSKKDGMVFGNARNI